MKIIEPSVELVDDINAAGIYAKIERCGRVCYQSAPKGEPEKFIRMLIKRGHESVLEHVSLTFHIICDRAIQNELVRHRHASFSVESTRYVKYSKAEIAFIKPSYYREENSHTPSKAWRIMVAQAAENYDTLLWMERPPEDARAALPLCLKSELYMTCNLREWRYILKLRTSKHAHPQMRLIMNQILNIFRDKLPVIVEDIVNDNPSTN